MGPINDAHHHKRKKKEKYLNFWESHYNTRYLSMQDLPTFSIDIHLQKASQQHSSEKQLQMWWGL